jgi:hypothetical protein
MGRQVAVFGVSVVAFWIADFAQTRGLTTLANATGVLAALGVVVGFLLVGLATLRDLRAENGTIDSVSRAERLRRLDDPTFVTARRSSAAFFLSVLPLFLLEFVAQRLGYVRIASALAVLAFAAIVAGLGVALREVFRLHRGDGTR